MKFCHFTIDSNNLFSKNGIINGRRHLQTGMFFFNHQTIHELECLKELFSFFLFISQPQNILIIFFPKKQVKNRPEKKTKFKFPIVSRMVSGYRCVFYDMRRYEM